MLVGNQGAPLSFIPVVTTVEPRGGGHAATDTTRCAPRDQETGIRRIIRTFDPEVPGYVFWLVMLGVISFHQLVLHVR